MTRKEFLVGSAALSALGGCRKWESAKAEPRLRLGVISDIHYLTKKPWPHGMAEGGYEAALRCFDRRKADGVLCCGDLTDFGTAAALRHVARIWRETFPGGRRTDGEPIANLFHLGDHDMGAFMHKYAFAAKSCAEPHELDEIIPFIDTGKLWEECFHEKWAPIQAKTVKGYTFVLAHHPRHDAESKDGNRIPGLAEFLKTLKIDPKKPFFYSQHRPGREGETKDVLSRYPNAIGFYGHVHRTNADERANVWQDGIVSLLVPSVAYCCTDAGRANSFRSSIVRSDALMRPVELHRSWQAMFVEVYEDRLTVERFDLLNGLKMGRTLAVPLPTPAGHLSLESRKARSVAPEFAAGAAITLAERTEPNAAKKPVERVVVSFPVAHGDAERDRAYDYEVVAEMPDGRRLARAVFSQGIHWADEKDTLPVECHFAKSELPADWRKTVRFTVTPRDSYGNRGVSLKRMV